MSTIVVPFRTSDGLSINLRQASAIADSIAFISPYQSRFRLTAATSSMKSLCLSLSSRSFPA